MGDTGPLAVGDSYGRYAIEGVLGRGGMGVVYLARDARLDRLVALKLMAPELREDATLRQRFLDEAKVAASVDHPNVIPVFEAGDKDDRLFLAMRYVDGQDLRQLLLRVGRLGAQRTLVLIGQVAAALDALHARGLVHRDVKPANVLITQTGGAEHVYLTDFGLSTTVGMHGLTGTGQIVGTLDYLAPEQIEGGEIDHRADVYALGCLLYHCLTGMPPYAGSEAALLWAHIQQPPPRPRDTVSDLPVGIDGVVAQALAKRADERFHSAQDLLRAACEAASEHAIAAPTWHVTEELPGLPREPSDTIGLAPRVPHTRLIGREAECTEVMRLLAEEPGRLVTIIGPGGVGKTRVAAELTKALAPTTFVDLAPITDAFMVPATIASSIGLREDTERSALDVILGFLRRRTHTLIIDNAEHLTDGVREAVMAIRGSCPNVRFIVTSRSPLRISGEQRFPLKVLNVESAVRLYMERARSVEPGIIDGMTRGSVEQLCTRLDCLPLAIELAAARSSVISPTDMFGRLGGRSTILGRSDTDAPTRHETLESTLDWSYDLLSPPERVTLGQLGVIAGSCSLDAVEAILGAGDALESIEALMDASLLQREGAATGVRFSMLQTIKDYALRQADSPALDVARKRHAEYFASYAADAADQLRGPAQKLWFQRLDGETDNLRAALQWLSHSNPTEATKMAGGLAWYWYVSRRLDEGRRWLTGILQIDHSPSAERATCLVGLGIIARYQGDFDSAEQALREAIELSAQIHDRHQEALATDGLGVVAALRGRSREARAMFAASLVLFDEAPLRIGAAEAKSNLGLSLFDENLPDAGRAWLEDALCEAASDEDAYTQSLT